MREVRCGGVSRWNVALAVALALLVSAALGPPAWAAMRYGPLQISGNVDSLNLVRHSNPEKFGLIMNRNALRLRVDWDWLQNGRLIDRFDLPFIERSKFYLLYRGVYDSFYDIAPGGNQIGQTRYDDLIGGPIIGNHPGQCVGGSCDWGGPSSGQAQPKLLPGLYSRVTDQDRSNDKFENNLREVYIDFKLKNAPLSFRLGRQQVIWGESDQFRVMDIINPLDLTWHFQVESWDEVRTPLWLGKGLWDIGELGPLSNTFLEVIYNPFDFKPSNTVDFLPRPWTSPFPDPLRYGQIDNNKGNPTGALVSPIFHMQGSNYLIGDFKRNPQDASEVGARFHGVTPQGFEFALNYLYGRGRAPGGANTSAFKITDMYFSNTGNPHELTTIQKLTPIGYYTPDINNPGNVQKVLPLHVVGKMVYPYNHIFGMTGNYFEGDYTQSVLRFETLYAMGEPFASTDPATLVPVRAFGLTPAQSAKVNGTSPLGFTKRDMWIGMAGFDRPTWIRFLNPKATWFLTFQFFWTYVNGPVNNIVGNGANTGDYQYYGPVGKWASGPFAGLIERQQNAAVGVTGNGDQWHRWEHLITCAATSFYRSGTVVPFIANAWDPVNDSDEILWNVDYFYSNNFIISLQQKFFTTYGSKRPSNDNEYTAGRFDRRDETGVRLTYQF